MYEALFVTPWPFWAAGPLVGLCVLSMYFVLNRPLGVSTGLGTACGVALGGSRFTRGAYAERWRLSFLVGILLGGLVSAALAGAFARGAWPTTSMGTFDALVGAGVLGRGAVLFLGGVLLGFGARLAGGCTSGHSITGIGQLAPSSVLATLCFMAGGGLVANLLARSVGV